MPGFSRKSSLQLAQTLAKPTQGKKREIPDQRTMRYFAEAFIKQNEELQQARAQLKQCDVAHVEKLEYRALTLANENAALRKSNNNMRAYKSKTNPYFDHRRKR